MSKKTINVQLGGGFTGLLTILFIALKLMGHISWSWWMVFSPLWIPWCVIFAALIFFVLIKSLIK